jgi:hypothetical protein
MVFEENEGYMISSLIAIFPLSVVFLTVKMRSRKENFNESSHPRVLAPQFAGVKKKTAF